MIRRYKKTATVLAELADHSGLIDTPEGMMVYSEGQHYLVTDDPPTHTWPVRKDLFESTHELVREIEWAGTED